MLTDQQIYLADSILDALVMQRSKDTATEKNIKQNNTRWRKCGSLQGLILNNNLTWDTHLEILIKKLNRAIGLLSKIRHYTPKFLLRTIYYSLFNSHLIYGCQVWGQRERMSETLRKIANLQDKALRIINFLPPNTPIDETYKTQKILKLFKVIYLSKMLFL